MLKVKRDGFGSFQGTETAAKTSALSLFEPEIIEKSVRERKECIIRPTSISEQGPIQITIQPEGEYFIDPGTFEIHADFCIEKWDSTTSKFVSLAATDAKKVAPINMFTKALWKDIEVYLNQQQISLVATTAYPVKAYLETVLSYGENAAKTLLSTSHYVKIPPGKHDKIGDDNPAFADLNAIITNSKTVRMCDVLHTELCTMDRFLLPGLTIDFRFSLNNPSLYLMHEAADSYRIRFIDCFLKFDRILLHEHEHALIERQMTRGARAIYPINRGTVRTKQIGSGEIYARWHNLYSGVLPDDILICMVDSKAFNGACDKNIFNFQHFKLDTLSLKVNSQLLPVVPLQCDFENKDVLKAYKHMFNNLGIKNSNAPCLVTFEDFCQGTTIFPFDLTPDKCSSFHSHEKQSGNIELDIRFKEALSQGITIFAICNFSDRILITGPSTQREIHINPTLQG
jgi:hypothetical protein